MIKKLVVGLAAAAVAVFVLAWAAAPVFAAQALIRAAKAGDAARIEQLVDFPALRQSLKDELTAELAAHMRRDPRLADSRLGGLGMILAPMLLSGAVDAAVTPEVVAQMVTTAEAPDPTVPDQPEPGDAADKDDIHQSWGYRDLNAFAVTLTDRDQPDQRLALILERRGLFAWKLAAVDIQNDARP
ncbi:MAG: DUF2939 domain-containing protein [Alphaproteobacteria bacterium]|nr:DUF2939 domain-containing protein [Alphaproteobacteria bacterium]MBU2269930.1 DUF2939 domain-containing protein [Alphaproteobacteria bacterium]MBU2418748.1 DUF2939 domain-containing protein [Alphaproteobacteria bacterium]